MELAATTGPPGFVITVEVEITAVDVEVDVAVVVGVVGEEAADDEEEAEEAEEEEEEEESTVVTVVTPAVVTDVRNSVTVGRGKPGRTRVVVRPSEMTMVVDCADAALKRAASARRDLRAGILTTDLGHWTWVVMFAQRQASRPLDQEARARY